MSDTMKTILHIDASARSGSSGMASFGSHSRRLSARFVSRWRERRPQDRVLYRDVGQTPPQPVTPQWIHAAFTPTAERSGWMNAVLQESDMLVDELRSADIVVAGVPMYNFGVPAQFKAYIDNIVRVGRTFGFDRECRNDPYSPLLAERHRRLVILSSRGHFGYGAAEPMVHMNHVEPAISTVFGFIGITDVTTVAVEYDEFGDTRLAASIARAEKAVDELVGKLARAELDLAV